MPFLLLYLQGVIFVSVILLFHMYRCDILTMPIDVDNALLFRNGGINSFPLLGPLFDYIPNASKTYLVVRQAASYSMLHIFSSKRILISTD